MSDRGINKEQRENEINPKRGGNLVKGEERRSCLMPEGKKLSFREHAAYSGGSGPGLDAGQATGQASAPWPAPRSAAAFWS